MEAKTRNGAQVMVVDPRFNRSAAVADFYAPIRAGSDAAFMLGVINYLLTHDKIQHEYVKAYTNAALIVREDFQFHEGLFSGYDAATRSYATTSWDYERDEQGFAKQDPTFQNPRCVLNLLRDYTSRYTPELVSQITGTPEKIFCMCVKLWPPLACQIAHRHSCLPLDGRTIPTDLRSFVQHLWCKCCWVTWGCPVVA